jgi:hypothetical protein
MSISPSTDFFELAYSRPTPERMIKEVQSQLKATGKKLDIFSLKRDEVYFGPRAPFLKCRDRAVQTIPSTSEIDHRIELLKVIAKDISRDEKHIKCYKDAFPKEVATVCTTAMLLQGRIRVLLKKYAEVRGDSHLLNETLRII